MEPAQKAMSSGTSGDASGATPADTSALAARMQDLEQQLAKMTDLAARAQADLQNAKARMQKDSDEIRKYAAESVLQALLPVLDNFRRALTHLPAELAGNEWAKGVMATEGELWKRLSDLGLRRLASLGQQVDTAKHEVVTLGPGNEGEIIEVLEDGYELHGKILRPARVKVGDGSPS